MRSRKKVLKDSSRAGPEIANVSTMVVAAIRKSLVCRQRMDGGRHSEVAGRLELEDGEPTKRRVNERSM